MSEIDWNPLLCEIAALRHEVRASSFAALAATEKDAPHREEALAMMKNEQETADRVARGGKA